MRSRLLVSVIGVPVLLYIVLLAPVGVIRFALVLLSAFAAFELMHCLDKKRFDFLTAATIVAAGLHTALSACAASDSLPVFFGIYVFACSLYGILKEGTISFNRLSAGIVAVILIPYSFSSFLRIAVSGKGRAWVLLPFLLSFACDTFAYFAGRKFGRHKLAPKVSPKKTIEGSVGGICGNIVFAILFALVLRGRGMNVSIPAMILLGLCCAVTAQIGDLTFSMIKREHGIKDYSRLFLEHGGVLDRFDSVLFVAPVVEWILFRIGG